jgi:uncharacterized protein (DUF362 family)
VAKKIPRGIYNYMWELHGSPYQRLMIAEINKFYSVDVVIIDALRAFVSEGPERGEMVKPNILLASKDRVAIDAVGIALLRSYGSTSDVMKRRIFELDQICRAAKLKIGVKSTSDITLTPMDEKSIDTTNTIRNILRNQG